jgi:hypothetical protein
MERNHLVTFHTRDAQHRSIANENLKPRRYARLNTAVPRVVQILLDQGSPGDVAEIAHAEHGFQIGTVKVHAGGRIAIQWTLEV